MSIDFNTLPRNHFAAIQADPPWNFATWSAKGQGRAPDYKTSIDDIAALPVSDRAADDCVLFLWVCWPTILDAFKVIEAWGFKYSTCAFCWTKADASQIDMFRDDADVQMGLGYWTRANTEPCLLATRGKNERLNADVRQAIIAPRREIHVSPMKSMGASSAWSSVHT